MAHEPGASGSLLLMTSPAEIPAAGHHVMLDQPIALIAALRTLLSDWDHSRPGPPPVG